MPLQVHGHPVDCVAPFTVGYECYYECDTGYILPNDGTYVVECRAGM